MAHWTSAKSGIVQSGFFVQKQTFKVALLVAEHATLNKAIYDELKRQLGYETECRFVIKLFVAGGSRPLLLDRYVDIILDKSESFSALVTLGSEVTRAAKRRTAETGNRLPVIFLTEENPVAAGFIHSYHASRNNLVGMCLKPLSSLFPINLLPKICRKHTRFIIPYHKKVAPGQLLFEIEEACQRLSHYGYTLVMHPYEGKRLTSELFDTISQYDALLLPQGGISKHDYDSFISYAASSNIDVYGGQEGFPKTGGLFGTRSDVLYVARKLSSMITATTLEQKSPAKLALNELIHASTFLYEPYTATTKGVSFSQNYICAFEADFNDELTPPTQIASQKLFSAYCEDNTLGLQEGLENLVGEITSEVSFESEPIYKIAVLVPENGALYRAIQESCKTFLKQIMTESFHYDLIVTGGTAPYLVDQYAKNIIEKKYDAIFTIGLSCSLAAKRMTTKLQSRQRTPIVFAAVSKHQAHELIHSYKDTRNNLIGITVAPPCALTPIQALRKLNPEARSFFIPYREEFMQGKMLHDMKNTKEHFKKQGCSVTLYPYTGSKLASGLFEHMKTHDAVVVPEGGAKTLDRDAILDFCKNRNIDVYADGKDAVKKGAVFACTSDMEYVSRRAAEMIKLVTEDGKNPSKLSCSELIKTRQLVYNEKNASNLGVNFSNDYKMMLETCTKNNVPMPRQMEDEKLLLAYCEDNSLGLQEAMRALTKQIEEQVDYITNEPVSTDSDVIDMSQVAAQKPAEPKPFKQRQEEKKKKIESDINKIIHKGFVQSLYIAGPQAIQAAAQRMEEKDRHRPLSAIQFAQSLEEAVGLDIQMPPGNTVHATIMQPPRAETIAHYLKEYMGSDLRSAYFLIGHDALQDESYISSFSVQAKMLNFRVNPIIVENEFDIQRAMEKHHKRHNAFFGVTHLISPSLMEGMVFYGNEFKIMTLAPSLQLGKEAPLSLGLNSQAFSEEVSPFQQLSPVLYARVIPADILYLHGANAARLAAMGYQKSHERVLRRAHKIILTG